MAFGSEFICRRNYKTDGLICLLQGLAVMTTKMAAGEDLREMLPTTVLGDVLIGTSQPSSMTVGQARGEGVYIFIF